MSFALRALALTAALILAACGSEESAPPPAAPAAAAKPALPDAERLALINAAQANEGLTKKRCLSCHYFDQNMRRVGPTLMGIVGRKPSIEGVPFAVWDELALDTWLSGPLDVKPGTKMALPGIESAEERAGIIAYLKTLKSL